MNEKLPDIPEIPTSDGEKTPSTSNVPEANLTKVDKST
jgi:hypothetical protein